MSISFENASPGPIEPELLTEVLVKLLREAGRVLDDDAHAARSSITRAMALLATLRERDRPAEDGGRGCLAPWQVRRVKAYVEAHLDGAILIEDLRLVTRLSPSYFSAAFRRTFGETPHAHLIRRRVERAQELMLTTDEPLSQIAIACGLCDQAHLSKLFRRALGISPNLWRRQRRDTPTLALAA